MSTENQVLLSLRVDAKSAQDQLRELANNIANAKEEQKQLDAQFKEGKVSLKDYTDSSNRLKLQISDLNNQHRLQVKAMQDTEKANKALEGSNDQLRAQLSLLTKEYNALSRVQRNSEAGKAFQAQIKAISDELKRNEEAVGDNRRSVGDYAKGLAGGLKNGLQAGIQGITGFSMALNASPVGLITTAIQFLTQAFGGLEPVIDFVEQKTAALTAAFNEIIGSVGGFISALMSGESITTAYSNNIAGMGSRIMAAALEADKLKKAIQDLEDAESDALVTTAKNNKEIGNLIIKAKDRTKTEKERLAFLDEAAKKEEANFLQELIIAKERERIAKEELKRAEQASQDTGELRRKARQAEADRINLEASSADLLERIANRRNALIEEENRIREAVAEKEKERQRKAAEDAEKRRVAEEKYYQELASRRLDAQLAIADAEDKLRQARNQAMNERVEQLYQEQAYSLLEAEWAEKAAERKIAARQAETIAARQALDSAIEIATVFAEHSAAAGDFAKALTLFQIGIDMAKAISNITAGSAAVASAIAASSGPAGIVTGPAAYAAYYATNIASLVSSMAQAYKLVGAADTPKPAFYEGGYTGAGNPREESTRLGTRPYTYHKDEYIIPSKVLNTEAGAELAARAEAMRRAIPGIKTNIRGFFNGGLFQQGAMDAKAIAREISNEFAKLPAPVVNVKEVTAMQQKVARVQDRTSL